MRRKAIRWIVGFSVIAVALLAYTAYWVIHVDPFFHYHAPRTDDYFYPLNNQRSQNDGIIKHFEYEGMITGTSMTENCKTSLAEELWGCAFIKIPCSGGSYKEVNDNVAAALKSNPELRIVIRGVDMLYIGDDKDKMRNDLGTYPTYLLDDDPFNDMQYLFNRDVVFSRVYSMVHKSAEDGARRGITSFDDYSNWMNDGYHFGKNTLYPGGIIMKEPGEPVELTENDRERIRGNVRQNLTSVSENYPNVTFYYFIPPYSAQWWQDLLEKGTIRQQVEMERILIEELLKYKNIKLYSFNNLTNITTNLNHYKDAYHYGEWINTMILWDMYEDKNLLTTDNYETYLEEELKHYSTFDYTSMNNQEDYDNDLEAADKIMEEMYD